MNLTKCGNGHYYDADKFDHCPHCSKAEHREDGKGAGKGKPESVSLRDAVKSATSPARFAGEENRTVSYYGGSMQTEPVVGWLVCIEGACLGKAFELKNGKNFIGRALNMDVILEGDPNVSRERHAIVTYEPKNRLFVAQPGDSRELFYVNGEVVLMNVELHNRDVLYVGKTRLMFVPFCGAEFAWEDVKNR